MWFVLLQSPVNIWHSQGYWCRSKGKAQWLCEEERIWGP